MKKFFAAIVALLAVAAVANAAEYSVDEAAIDALFTEAVVEAPAEMMAPMVSIGGDATTTNLIALVVDYVGLGLIGIHRLILGTNPLNCLWYFLTFGGIFGVLPIVDGVVLIIDLIQGGANYLDNPKFIMWL
ncbi:MAG: hypothetical protein J6W09_02550 [Bacteroidales bacterium]|nr:hypothetical protein [Bacteroidales bacterium]